MAIVSPFHELVFFWINSLLCWDLLRKMLLEKDFDASVILGSMFGSLL